LYASRKQSVTQRRIAAIAMAVDSPAAERDRRL
jgi:hypothetical protein